MGRSICCRVDLFAVLNAATSKPFSDQRILPVVKGLAWGGDLNQKGRWPWDNTGHLNSETGSGK